jgi:protein arginine kinase activator
MTCQRCGQRDATVHLVELVDGQRKSQWLCAVCAGRASDNNDETPGFRFGESPEDGNGEGDDLSLANFLGQVFEPRGEVNQPDPPVCQVCGYTLDQFRSTNRLGCPRCYEAFRGPLLAILGHLHRHVSHLGKTPRPTVDGADRPGVLSRSRVALEKAIAAEDFEKAAHLRDEIKRLESAGPEEGTSKK